MNNLDFRFYFWIFSRRFPVILVVTAIAIFAAVVAAQTIKPVYTASAKLLVEAPQIPADLAKSTVPMSATAQLLILQQEMTTHDALVALASKLRIYNSAAKQPSDEDIVSDLRSRIEFRQLQLETQDPLVAIYSISFDAERPDVAASVTNEMVNMILQKNQHERTVRASSTLAFFDDKVVELERLLKRLDDSILEFKKAHGASLPENLDFSRNELLSQENRRSSLEREASELRSRRGALVAAYTNVEPLPGAEPRLTPDQLLLVDLNRALSEQLTIFSEESPNIASMRKRVSELQKRILASRVPISPDNKAGRKTAASPFGLDLQLSEIDDRLAKIAAEREELDSRISNLRASVAQGPESEASLASQLRERENLQKQYNAAIAQRAAASTGEQLEMRSDGERFSLLEPAIAPTKPTGPKRRLILGAGAVAGLGGGLMLVIILELFNKKLRRPKDVTDVLQVEPLASIPIIKTAPPRKGWRAAPAVAVMATLSWLPGGLLELNQSVLPGSQEIEISSSLAVRSAGDRPGLDSGVAG